MNSNTEIALAIHHLFHAINFLSHVHELATRAALYCHGHHEIHSVFSIFRLAVAWDQRWIEIRRVVFVQNFALAHFARRRCAQFQMSDVCVL